MLFGKHPLVVTFTEHLGEVLDRLCHSCFLVFLVFFSFPFADYVLRCSVHSIRRTGCFLNERFAFSDS